MIASLTGTVKSIQSSTVVIEVGGVGMLVQVSPRLSVSLTVGLSTSLHTVLLVREDALTLYGFEASADRELFELLQTVSGIGPKVAQSALSTYETPQLISAIFNGDGAILEKISGLGKKGAQRLILELKEKVVPTDGVSASPAPAWREKITKALTGLGFSPKEALDTAEAVALSNPQASSELIENLLREALQLRGRM